MPASNTMASSSSLTTTQAVLPPSVLVSAAGRPSRKGVTSSNDFTPSWTALRSTDSILPEISSAGSGAGTEPRTPQNLTLSTIDLLPVGDV